MSDNREYDGVANPYVTRYVIMEFNPCDLKYPVSMATNQVFKTIAEAQAYIDAMSSGKNKMIVPIVRQALDD